MQELTNGVPAANLLTGLRVDEVFSRTDSAGTRSFLPDALGSTLALTDGLGSVQTQYTYEPFGQTTVTGAASSNPFQYTGRENDGTGLYYYRARYYHPALQRFISEDPLFMANGPRDTNKYSYVLNNPLKLRDPFGLYGTDDCGYYGERCLEDPGRYYCKIAPWFCNQFPKPPDPDPEKDDDYEGFNRCMRQCLQDCDKSTCPSTKQREGPVGCHVDCFGLCTSGLNHNPYPF